MNNRRKMSLAEEMGLGSRLELYVLLAALAVSVVLLAYGAWM
ncbi:MAG: hypothetical protein SPF60_01650 [Lachnospiraceae bacterium]|nr:hypothetical protein [Oscillospiraceae bacterium]MDY5540123.1 hypothetical protein [Lachnospiraceae bacterium]MDY5649267.1 hypothetical protein [Lachnospiraceae bacterium]